MGTLIDFSKAKRKRDLRCLPPKDREFIDGIDYINRSNCDRMLKNSDWKRPTIFTVGLTIFLDCVLYQFLLDPQITSGWKSAFTVLMIINSLLPFIVFLYRFHEYKSLLRQRNKFNL